ncbi:MAG: transcription antitermination factor NusB [Chloroflexota bacterium]|nr:transcription antitermination factor NusB [Chloroflexota bacterium]
MSLTNPINSQPEPVYASDSTIGRQIALQTLYEVDIARHDALTVLLRHLHMQEPPARAARMARILVLGVDAHRARLDLAVSQRASEFPIELLAVIDRNVLRIALYEFAVWGVTPIAVAIDEAVELAKDFAAEGAPGFINGVLRSIAQDTALVEAMRTDPNTPDEAAARAAVSTDED